MPLTDKSITQEIDHSGSPKYNYKGSSISILPYFLYEVSIHKYWKLGYCLLGYKYFKSDKLLDNSIETKKFDGYSISKEINLIAAPYKFIVENNLQKFEKLKKNEKVRRSH